MLHRQNPNPLRTRHRSWCGWALAVLVPAVLVPAAVWSARAASPLDAVVGVRAEIPGDARTAEVLGTAREGSGILIGPDGLVLTIGYLILEAASAEITLHDGSAIPAEVVAYDYRTGFGLLRPLKAPDLPPIQFGSSRDLVEDSPVLVASFGGEGAGRAAASAAYVVSRREFAGYWEYLLPDAIFTAPPHGGFGGAALIGPEGKLLGIGSLIVGDAAHPGAQMPGNMFVPIDALKPILAELAIHGRAQGPVRPWLGVYAEELRGRLFINRLAPGGPAATAGLARDDVILAVQGAPVHGLADFYRKVWALGTAGVTVPLTVLSGQKVIDVAIPSGDRYDYLKLNPSY